MKSFASMHNDYLDPDRHMPAEDYGYDDIIVACKGYGYRWQWDVIDLCWTGKDADLETHGHQGLHIDNVDEEFVYATVHALKTTAGTDVCLNEPAGYSDAQSDKAHEAYMEQAEALVCGCGFPGEWDGDSWAITTSHKVKSPVFPNEDESGIDAEKTVAALQKTAEKSLADWDREMRYLEKLTDEIAGWKHPNCHRCKEGAPGKSSIFNHLTP